MLFSDMGEPLGQGGSITAVGLILTPVEGLKVIRHGAAHPSQAVTAGYAVFRGDTILNDGTDPVQGPFSDGSLTMAGIHPFRISYDSNFETGSMTGGNDVAVQYIPEPSSAVLLSLGALALRRRRSCRG